MTVARPISINPNGWDRWDPAQRLEYAEQTFEYRPELERLAWIREHLPAAAERWPQRPQLDGYLARRRRLSDAREAAGQPGLAPPAEPPDADELRAAVAALGAPPTPVHVVDAEQRAAFREVARTRPWPQVVAAYQAWCAAIDEALAAGSAHAALRSRLGITAGGPVFRKPVLTVELDRAVGSPRPFVPAPGER